MSVKTALDLTLTRIGAPFSASQGTLAALRHRLARVARGKGSASTAVKRRV